MLDDGCICALIPRIATSTRLVLAIHEDEARKPTNTGLLAARCLVNSTVHVVTSGERAPVAFHEGERALLLFPSDDAIPLREVVRTSTRFALVVPDGTWRQTRKMRARVPGLEGATCVTLDDASAPTEYRLREERRPGGLATLEAIARALAILEGAAGDDVAAQLLVPFRAMVARTLATRGVR